MTVSIDNKAIDAIIEIVNRGNKAVIQRSGSGVIVMEEKRKIRYGDATPSRAR